MMAHLRIRFAQPGDAPGRWTGELRTDDEVPDLGQDVELPSAEGPRRGRVVALLFKATLAVVGIDAEVYVSSDGPSAAPPALFCTADPAASTDH